MSSSNSALQQGDLIFHPKYGFGAVHGLTRRDRLHPVKDTTVAETDSESTEDYYDILLDEGGTLLVPVSRARGVGLRLLTNGLATVKADLSSAAQSLPGSFRARAAELRLREQLDEPGALARSVRDLLAHARRCNLSPSEKTWLERSCQRLSTEAALVDAVSMFETRAAVLGIVRQLSLR